MTNAEASMTCGFKLAGRFSLAGTGVTAPGVSDEEWVRARWATGTAAGQVDLAAECEQAVPAGGFIELDLYGGLVLDGAGATLAALLTITGEPATFQTLRAIQVQIASGAGGLRVGGAVTNPHPLWFGGAAHTHEIEAGGPPVYLAGGSSGKAVDATNRRVRLTNLDGADPVTVRVALAGVKL